jgi:outer membrane PBP1 activator LpoA protein
VLLCAVLISCATPPPQQTPVEDRQGEVELVQSRSRALAGAEAALARGDAQAAREYLDDAQPAPGEAQGNRYRRALEALQALEADPVGQAVSRAATQIDGMGSYDTVHGVALMQTFEAVPVARLEALSGGTTPLASWAALAVSVRRDLLANTELLKAANTWQAAHPGHIVQAPEYMELCWQYRQNFPAPARIAVILPFGGALGAAAEAIRDGMLGAWLDRPAAAQLDFLPAGDDPESALSAYLRAAQGGYQFVIGPLRRESTQRIAELPELPVPVLLLNDPPVSVPPAYGAADRRVYSLSLSQQAESRALARHVLELGYRRAIILAADDSWGSAVEQGFNDAMAQGEGEVVATARFNSASGDHAEVLTEVLRIEESRQRKSRLQGALGLSLEFEASRRDDFDVFLLAADPVLGRQLKPQLRFFDAGGKPIYAMSRIYAGQPDPTADQDLNGVRFAATRAALPQTEGTRQLANSRSGAFASLQALGADAWGILPWMGLLSADPTLEFPGATGKLRLLPDGSLSREPLWLQFEKGRPALAEATPPQ